MIGRDGDGFCREGRADRGQDKVFYFSKNSALALLIGP
jgi:hypothetical protein